MWNNFPRLACLFLVISFFKCVYGQGNYYDSANGLSGNTLRNQLRIIITNGHTPLGYDAAKARMFQNIDNVNGYVRCVYTGRDFNVGFTYTGSGNPNTEHSFCQSWFEGMPEYNTMRCDLHHLYPTDSTVNSSRGNYPFDNVQNQTTYFPSFNGYVSKKGTNSQGYIVFEPADQHKGDVARSLLYMMVRYNTGLTYGNVNQFQTLVDWNYEDPVSNYEIARNNSIYSYQHNRNPFVDHPEYVNLIWNTQNNDDENISSVNITAVYPNPAKDCVSIAFKTKQSGTVDFTVYDMKGHKVKKLSHNSTQAGEYIINWSFSSEPSHHVCNGVYYIRSSLSSKQRKIVILR